MDSEGLISKRLRAAIKAAPSRYQISKATGIAESVLSRFVNGKAGLDLQTIDKLARHLRLDLVPSSPRPKKK